MKDSARIKNKFSYIILLLLIGLSLAMHAKHLKKDLISIHTWRQTQTQSNIINFYEGDMNIFNPQRNERGNGSGIYRMEFPLMQWLIAIVYKILGNHLILTRISIFIIGAFSVIGMYRLIKAIFNNDIISLIGAWTFNFSPSFFYYTINPIPDNLALTFGIWGLALLFEWNKKSKLNLYVLGLLFLSLSALCKLPFIIYFLAPITLLYTKQAFPKVRLILIFIVFISLPVSWYVSVIPKWSDYGIVKGVLGNTVPLQISIGYFTHNLFSTLPELLINYGSMLFFLAGIYFAIKNGLIKKNLFKVFALISITLFAYYLYEINMIANVHDYYLFPFLPFLFIIVSYGAFTLFKFQNNYLRAISIILLLILPITTMLRMQSRWNVDSPGFNKDFLSCKDELGNIAPNNELCIVGNDISHYIYFYYINKKGWGFQDNNISPSDFENDIKQGAKYLYSDSRIVDENPEISKFFDVLKYSCGSIRVYKLKN